MKTRPAPGGPDTPEAYNGGDNAALVEASAPPEPATSDAAVDDVEALFPETGVLGAGTSSSRVRAPRRPVSLVVREFFRNLSLDDRLGRILLSIVLAILLWFYVTSLENPARTTDFNDLVAEPRNVGENLKIINTLPSIDVSIQAPQNVMSTLRPGDVHPFVDLKGLNTGVHQLPVQLEVSGTSSRSLISWSVSPDEVQVQLEAQASRVFTITARTKGTPAYGHGIEQPQIDPTEITVAGPAEAVDRVAQVVVSVNVEGEATTQQGLLRPVALDGNGQQVQGVTFDPESVQVVVPIKLLLSYKVVAVRPNVAGNPAPGYSVTAINPDPRSVTICCAKEEILDPIQSLDTQAIGITNTTSTVITKTQLIIPEGVELYPGQSSEITVTIRLETFETSFTLAVVPTVEGLPAGTSAVVSPGSIDVSLTGTLAQFQVLRPEEVRAVLDMGSRGPGTYEIEPRIVVPQGIRVEQVAPQRLTVSVVAPTAVPPTVTPTALDTPTPVTSPTATLGAAAVQSPSPVRTPEPSPSPSGTEQPGVSEQPQVSPEPTNGVLRDETN